MLLLTGCRSIHVLALHFKLLSWECHMLPHKLPPLPCNALQCHSVSFRHATCGGPYCHVVFIVDSSKSMATRDLKLEGRVLRRIDGALLKEYVENDPGHGQDKYTAVMVSDQGLRPMTESAS